MTAEHSEKKDDPVALFILEQLNHRMQAISPDELARSLYATKARKNEPGDAWRKYLPAIRQQALFLARRGRLHILRRGEVADPQKPIRGLIKLALPPHCRATEL